MKQASENCFRPGEVGQSITVKIPDVDRARSDFRNIIGVILSMNNNMYEIGTKEGHLSTFYSRNQFVICKERFLKVDDVSKPRFNSERQHGNFLIWVVRVTTDVRVYKNVKHGSASAKLRSDYAHQNATGVVHAIISNKLITLSINIIITQW